MLASQYKWNCYCSHRCTNLRIYSYNTHFILISSENVAHKICAFMYALWYMIVCMLMFMFMFVCAIYACPFKVKEKCSTCFNILIWCGLFYRVLHFLDKLHNNGDLAIKFRFRLINVWKSKYDKIQRESNILFPKKNVAVNVHFKSLFEKRSK